METLINLTFNYCVDAMIWLAAYSGTTYQFVNIVLFVIGMPGIIVLQFLLITKMYFTNTTYKRIIRHITGRITSSIDNKRNLS